MNIEGFLNRLKPFFGPSLASFVPRSLGTMNYLLQSSRSIQSKVKAGQLELVGAIFDNKSGRVEFMGRSPLEASILSGPGLRAPAETGVSPAYAMQLLQEGNARYALGTRNGGLTTAKELGAMRFPSIS